MNIDVHYFKARPNSKSWTDWKARVDIGKERFYIGPASFRTVHANVGNLVESTAQQVNIRFLQMQAEEENESG